MHSQDFKKIIDELNEGLTNEQKVDEIIDTILELHRTDNLDNERQLKVLLFELRKYSFSSGCEWKKKEVLKSL